MYVRMYVCMYVFIKLHITTQSGPVILVILCRSRMYVCMYVCMYVFIKLHITTQSGPVILVILCHSHRSSRGGINDIYYENLYVCIFIKLHITAQSGPVIYSFHATGCNPPGGYLS